MSYAKDFVVDEEQVVSFLENTLRFVENASEAELQALDEIKKLFKKNVGMFRRDYVTAMLIKNSLSHFSYSKDRGERPTRTRDVHGERTNDRYDRARTRGAANRDSYSNNEDRPRAPRVEIAPEAASTIFIGIGRTRRVFPRDLVGLLVSVAGLEKERIGNIRVLTNYSFVQLYTEDCEKTINALNGYDYRGRKLEVSYSKDMRGKENNADVSTAESTTVESTTEQSALNVENSAFVNLDSASNKTDNSSQINASSLDGAKENISYAAPVSSYGSSLSDKKPYSETSDDGQISSHFGDGAAY